MEILNQIILMLSIIMISSIGGWMLEKSGVMAIGIESIMTVSAYSFLAFYYVFGSNPGAFFGAAIFAVIIGGITNIFIQILMTFLKANQALVTLGFNIVMPTMLFLISLESTERGFGFGIPNMLPMIKDGYNLMFVTFLIIAIIVVGVVSFFVLKTKFGLLLNAIGENPYVVQSSGKNIYVEKLKIAFIAGSITAISGIFLSFFWTTWTNGGFYNGLPAAVGLGYISLGVIILSKWDFKKLLATMVIMGILIGLFYNFLYIWHGNTSLITFIKAMPYVIPMIILPFVSKTGGLPRQLGVNFSKNKRE